MPNPAAVRLLSIFAGYLPWPEWYGWEIHKQHLFPPGIARRGFLPNDLHLIHLQRRHVEALTAEREHLRQSTRSLADERDLLQDVVAELIDQLVSQRVAALVSNSARSGRGRLRLVTSRS